MKVAMVVPGGVDRTGEYRVIPCVLWLIERLARRHELHVFALHQEARASRYELLGATIHNIGRPRTGLRSLKAVIAEHRKRPFDVLHGLWAGSSGAVAAVAGRLMRRPVVVHVAGGELISLPDIGYGGARSWRGRMVVRLALRWASRVTAASPGIIAEAAAVGVTAERLVLGVDLEKWPVREPHPRQTDAGVRLLHVASLNRVKDQDTLLRAMAALRDSGQAFHLDVVGEDTLDGVVQQMVRTLDLERYVTLHGFLPHNDLRVRMDAADLLVMSSLHEAGPVVTLEAAVAGVPTVGTAVGHIAEWAPHAAVAVPVKDHEGLAREIERLADDEPTRLRIARDAQQRAVAHDADATAQQVEAIYGSLTESGGGVSAS